MVSKTPTEAYTGKDGSHHRAGSHKGEVHRIYDTEGREAAVKKAKAFKLQDTTAAVWTSTWARAGKAKSRKGAVKGKTTAKKPAAKKPAKKAKRKSA